MMDRSGILMGIRKTAAAVASAMTAVAQHVERNVRETSDVGRCRFEAGVIRDGYKPLKELLKDGLSVVREDWNDIIGNDMLIDEVKSMLDACSVFHGKAAEFDEYAIAHSSTIDRLLGDAWLPRAYLVMIGEWEDEAEPIIAFIGKSERKAARLDDPFRGIAAKLHQYFTGVTDDDIKEFVTNGVSLPGHPRWMQDKRQAIALGKMLGKSCKEMNDSFMFTKNNGEPVKLNYTSHGPILEVSQYEIYPFIRTLLDEME